MESCWVGDGGRGRGWVVKAVPMPSLARRRHLLVKGKDRSEPKACFSFSRDFKTLGGFYHHGR